jgi:hypothetical protein
MEGVLIGGASGNIPLLGAVLIAVIAALGGPLAVILQNRHQDKARRGDLKHEAYEELIAASEIMVLRSAVMGAQSSGRSAFASSLWDFKKAGVVLLMATPIGIPLRKRPEMMHWFLNSIPDPPPFEDPMDLKSLQSAFESLIEARVAVRMYGSNVANDAADKVIDDGKSFYALVQSVGISWSGLPATKPLTELRERLNVSTSAFVKISRSELGVK